MSYKELGLKCGLEIHQQIKGRKLFSNAPVEFRDEEPDFEIVRYQRASAGESGKVDVAAAQEQAKQKQFVYQGYNNTTSLVETDSEPPQPISTQAVETALQFCQIAHSHVVSVAQPMRKTIVDGSSTSGFQRTTLIAQGGVIPSSQGEVRIANISLEEDACRIISDSPSKKVYRLDRLGIPLIEIGTEPDITTPEQCQEVAATIGMMLRSLPGVKRGLGTIRQDVNISIKDGARIEIKGAQDLKQIPLLVELEVKRQQELLKLQEEVAGITLNPLKIIDVSQIFAQTSAKVIKKALEKKGKILGLKLQDFSGLLGRELQPNYRVGTELSGRAKIIAGVGGLFHSDELPNYGMTQAEVDAVSKLLNCKEGDGFLLVADKQERAHLALTAAYERVKELFIGVPKEVRYAQQDGTTRYLRPLPGAARMYPETDVPLIFPDTSNVQVPELLDAKAARFQKEYKLSADLAAFVAKSHFVHLFEELVKEHKKLKPAFIADTLTAVPAELEKKYQQDTNVLTEDHFRELFTHLSSGVLHKDIVIDALLDMCKGNFSVEKYKGMSTHELEAIVKEVLAQHKGAPFGALMGRCMKKVQGKASGEIVAKLLKQFS